MARTTPSESDFVGSEVTDEERSAPIADDVGHDTDDIEHADAPASVAKPAEPAEPVVPAVEEAPKMVDVRALQEARAESREAKQRAQILEERWNTFLAGQQSSRQAPQPEAPTVPKWDQDPIAAGAWTQQQIIAMQEAQATQQRETEQRSQQEQQFNQVYTKVNSEYEAAKAADPTIEDAYTKLIASQAMELRALGYSDAEAKQQIQQSMRSHIQYVHDSGRSIADHIKGLAAARGWQAAPAVPVAAPVVQRDLSAVAASQARHMSLSDANGGEVATPVDAKALANMTQKQFTAWMAKNGNSKALDELMGG